jgi:hypothetical protein
MRDARHGEDSWLVEVLVGADSVQARIRPHPAQRGAGWRSRSRETACCAVRAGRTRHVGAGVRRELFGGSRGGGSAASHQRRDLAEQTRNAVVHRGVPARRCYHRRGALGREAGAKSSCAGRTSFVSAFPVHGACPGATAEPSGASSYAWRGMIAFFATLRRFGFDSRTTRSVEDCISTGTVGTREPALLASWKCGVLPIIH